MQELPPCTNMQSLWNGDDYFLNSCKSKMILMDVEKCPSVTGYETIEIIITDLEKCHAHAALWQGCTYKYAKRGRER